MIRVPKKTPKKEKKDLIPLSTPVDKVPWQELGFSEMEEKLILTVFLRNRIETVLNIYEKLFSKTYNFNGYKCWDMTHTLIIDPGIGDRLEAVLGNKDREVFDIPEKVKEALGETFGPEPRVPQNKVVRDSNNDLWSFFESVDVPAEGPRRRVATSVAPPMDRDRREEVEAEEIPAQPQRKKREMPQVVPTGATNGSGESNVTATTTSNFVVPNSTPQKETVWEAVTYYPRQLVAALFNKS